MTTFEVFIPANEVTGINITAHIKANSWLEALKMGLNKLGDDLDTKNIICDFNDEGIYITEPKSQRTFRIRELTDDLPPLLIEGTKVGTAPKTSTLQKPVDQGQISTPTSQQRVVSASALVKGAVTAASLVKEAEPSSSASHEQPVLASSLTITRPVDAPARVVAEKRESELVANCDFNFGQDLNNQALAEEPSLFTAAQPNEDEIYIDLLERLQSVYSVAKDLTSVCNFFMDIAIEAIPSESGSVFMADIDHRDLYFAAARGPKAAEVMKFRVPMGVGIVGFSAIDGVTLAISDCHKDNRFYKEISKTLNYENRSILCCPIQQGGRVFGAIELINRFNGDKYSGAEIDLLNFICHEFANYLVNNGFVSI